MKQTDLAWAAGIIDGEGCIGIVKDARKALNEKNGWKLSPLCKLRISVGMSHLETIERLYELFGDGRVNGQKCYKKPGHKQVYYWVVNADQAWKIIKRVSPYLVTKKEQARVAEAFYGRERLKGGIHNKASSRVLKEREKLHGKMKKLNQRGDV
jgi:hypothetical protein